MRKLENLALPEKIMSLEMFRYLKYPIKFPTELFKDEILVLEGGQIWI